MMVPGRFLLAAAIPTVLLPVSLAAQSGAPAHVHPAGSPPLPEQTAGITAIRIPDVELTNQDGKRLRVYSDLIQGRIVVINTIFTTCTTICPLMGANFAKLSRLLTPEGPDKLKLISISVDPAQDTPERLKAWAAAVGGTGAEWTLLTGAKGEIDRLLKALQVFSADKQDHSPVVLIGGGEGDWTRASALLPPKTLAELVHTRLTSPAGKSTSRQ